jgi:hypothetical protein
VTFPPGGPVPEPRAQLQPSAAQGAPPGKDTAPASPAHPLGSARRRLRRRRDRSPGPLRHLGGLPFLGVEVLGGFTTFSVYVIDVQRALAAGAPRTALAYLAVTMVAALGSVYAGSAGRRLLTLSRGKDRP